MPQKLIQKKKLSFNTGYELSMLVTNLDILLLAIEFHIYNVVGYLVIKEINIYNKICDKAYKKGRV